MPRLQFCEVTTQIGIGNYDRNIHPGNSQFTLKGVFYVKLQLRCYNEDCDGASTKWPREKQKFHRPILKTASEKIKFVPISKYSNGLCRLYVFIVVLADFIVVYVNCSKICTGNFFPKCFLCEKGLPVLTNFFCKCTGVSLGV